MIRAVLWYCSFPLSRSDGGGVLRQRALRGGNVQNLPQILKRTVHCYLVMLYSLYGVTVLQGG